MNNRQKPGLLALTVLSALLLNPAPGTAFVTNTAIGVNGLQGFETYPGMGSFGSTNYADGWSLSNSRMIKWPNATNRTVTYQGSNAVYMSTASLLPWIRTPLLSNGVGSVVFYALSSSSLNPTESLDFETSGDGTTWSTNSTLTAQIFGVTNWNAYTQAINVTSPVFLRLHLTSNSASAQTYFDNLVLSYPRATISITNGLPSPNPATVNVPFNMTVTVAPVGLVSNVTVTNFWSNDGGGSWHAIAMITNGANSFITTNAIPGQSAVTIKYYFIAGFQGPDAVSPVVSSTNEFTVQAPANVSGLASLRVQGDLNTNLWVIGDYSWLGVAQSSSALTNALVKFQGVTTNQPPTTNTWGDAAQARYLFRIDGTASTNGTNIVIGGANSGAFIFTFVETNRAYSIDHGVYQSFDDWPLSGTSNAGWTSLTGMNFGDGDHTHRGQSAQLPANGWVMTPYLSLGIGQIGFWYRDYPTNGLPATTCSVQKSVDGANWTTLTNLTVNNNVYQRFTLTVEDRNSRYVRLLNGSGERLCLDDVTVTDPFWSGVTFGAVTNLPAVPTSTDTVTINATLVPAAGTSNIFATLYYRGGSSGAYTPRTMTNSGTNYSNSVAIPAGIGPDGGAGLVQYFIACTFQGYNSGQSSPAYYPPDTNFPSVYNIARSYLALTNAVTLPAVPTTTNAIALALDILPFASAYNATATAYYSFGSAAGPFTPIGMSSTGGNHFVTAPIAAQNVPSGTFLYYYFTATCLGANPLVPTNYPAGGAAAPLAVQISAAPFNSLYTNLVVSGGGLTPGMMLVGNGLWQGVMTVTNLVNPGFVFTGQNSGATNFGVTTQPVTNFPFFGTAVAGAGNIVLSGANNGPLVFSFDETTLAWSVLRADYVNFDAWTNGTGGYGNYTNSDGWVLTAGRVTSNSAPDTALAFLNRSGLLNAGPLTNQSLRSPHLANGVGQIGFWYRNAQTNGTPAAGFTVDLAPDPVAGPWTTVATVTNVLSRDYLHFTTQRSDRDNGYLRIRNLTATNHPALCLDEVIVTEPGAGIAFSAVTNVPASPIFLDNVKIAAVLTPLAGATGIAARVYYRDNTNTAFEYVDMATTGGNYYVTATALPATAAGNSMQYYLVASFGGFLSAQSSPVQYPSAGQPLLAYQVGDLTNDINRVQGFETYSGMAGFGSTNYADGWALFGSRLISTNSANQANFSYQGSNSVWFNAANTGPWIQTPLLSNGVGGITFYAASSKSPSVTELFVFETSTNGITWITNSTLTAQIFVAPNWTAYTQPINETNSIYLRLHLVSNSDSSAQTKIDNVFISYPPARVAVSNVIVEPGYPSITDPVFVACDVSSVSRPFAAYGISPKLWYRIGGVTNGPVPMNSIGGARYRSAAAIPPQPVNTRVEYSIQVDFGGYYGVAAEQQSPFYYPGGARTQSWTNYPALVRRGGSGYGEVDVVVNNSSLSMDLISPYQWQGIFTIATLTNQAVIVLQGLNPYTNGASQYGQTITLGDSTQWKTNTPLTGIAQAGGATFTLGGALQGQYVFQYNEQSGQYLLRTCTYQDFNNGWPETSHAYAFGSADNTPSVSPNFGLWGTNVARSVPQTFVSNVTWSYTNAYSLSTIFNNIGGTFWGANRCAGPTTNSELQTLNGSYNGYLVRPNNNPAEAWRGVGTLSLHCRTTNSGETTVGLYLCPTNANYDYDGDWIAVTNYKLNNSRVDIDFSVHTSATMSVILAHREDSGNNSVLFSNVNVSEWYSDTRTIGVTRAESFSGVPWTTASAYTNGLISSSTEYGIYDCRIVNASSTNWAETRATNNQGYVVQANRDLGVLGVGTLKLSAWAPSGDAGLAVFLAPLGDYTNRTRWVYVAGSSNVISGGAIANIQLAVNRATNTALVFAHTTGDAELRLSALSIASYDSTNAWVASEVWMESNSVSQCRMEPSRAETGRSQYLRTPLIADRAVQIAVDWLSGDATNPAAFDVYATSGDNSTGWGTNKLDSDSGVVTNKKTFTYAMPLNSTNLFFWVVNTSSNNGVLIVRDVVVTRARSTSLWLGNNVDVEGDSRAFSGLTCFLNSDAVANVVPPGNMNSILADVAPFVQSPIMTNGIGEISFWYRNWAITGGSPTPARLDILASPTGGTNNVGWVTLATITNIVNTNDYIYFTYVNFDSSNRYVRIQNNTNNQPVGRVCLDNVIVITPMACDVVLSNLTVSPRIPLYTNSVNVTVDLSDPFLFPSNILLTAYYQTGTTYGAWSSTTGSIAMTCIASNPSIRWSRYQTVSQIPALPVDTFVKYWVGATFDGYLTQATASHPKVNQDFVTPAWYRPLNYSASNAYYIVFSSPTGAVWINEFNVVDSLYGTTRQFVELAGRSGANIGNWRIGAYKNATPTNPIAVYTLTNGSALHSPTNGYGFWVLGMSAWPQRDMTMTNVWPALNGGIELKRSCGAIEQAICYAYSDGAVAALIANGFARVGVDESAFDEPVFRYGSITNGVLWGNDTDALSDYTPGGINYNQTFPPLPIANPVLTASAGANGAISPASTNVPPGGSATFVITATNNYRIASLTTNGTAVTGMTFNNNSTVTNFTWSNVQADGTLAATFTAQTNAAPSVAILGIWLNTNVWIVHTGANGWAPTPWYATNLSLHPIQWANVPVYSSTYPLPMNGPYTSNFPRLTNATTYFYTIVATNSAP